jgi:hypothetical protein
MSFFTGSSMSQRCINPLASGAFFAVEAGVKCLDKVWVVLPFKGIGGRGGRYPGPGPCAKAEKPPSCNPAKRTNVRAGNRELCFLFMVGFLLQSVPSLTVSLLNEANKMGVGFLRLKSLLLFVRINYSQVPFLPEI